MMTASSAAFRTAWSFVSQASEFPSNSVSSARASLSLRASSRLL
jgi:hypothetical protein